MENSYRFYRNTACKYFPCHKVENEEEFNCMFCYCLVPHSPKGYDYINKKLMAKISEMQRENQMKKQK